MHSAVSSPVVRYAVNEQITVCQDLDRRGQGPIVEVWKQVDEKFAAPHHRQGWGAAVVMPEGSKQRPDSTLACSLIEHLKVKSSEVVYESLYPSW